MDLGMGGATKVKIGCFTIYLQNSKIVELPMYGVENYELDLEIS